MADDSDVHAWIPEAYNSARFVLLTFPQRISISMGWSSSLKINTSLTGTHHPSPPPNPVTNTELITVLTKLAVFNYADSRKSGAFPHSLLNNILI
jgi:hypothetical protein